MNAAVAGFLRCFASAWLCGGVHEIDLACGVPERVLAVVATHYSAPGMSGGERGNPGNGRLRMRTLPVISDLWTAGATRV